MYISQSSIELELSVLTFFNPEEHVRKNLAVWRCVQTSAGRPQKKEIIKRATRARKN